MVRQSRSIIIFIIGCIIGYLLAWSSIHQYQQQKQQQLLQQQQRQQQQQIEKQQQTTYSKTKRKKFIYAGVMTAKKFLDTRAQVVFTTWGKDLPGNISFFASGKTTKHKELPIVSLKGVDDRYPPQRKSFMMLKYMHDNYINDYEWFLRADDDLYVNIDKLGVLLRGLNSSENYYIGQSGYGGSNKIRKLLNGNTFCMGGPGMIFSAGVLRKVAPYIDDWFHNKMRCRNEDVELGRFMKRVANISCLGPRKLMKPLFYHNFDPPNKAYAGKLNTTIIDNAITMHPFKKPDYMYKVDAHVKRLQLQKLKDNWATNHWEEEAIIKVNSK